MKRFHIHLGVKDLKQSVEFYTKLFGQEPAKLKEDYAKWMLDDPRLNFAISTRSTRTGLDHLGIQVEEATELNELTVRLKNANLGVYDEGETTCCYSESKKAWVKDPAGIPWEAYQTMADADVFHDKPKVAKEELSCCAPKDTKPSCC